MRYHALACDYDGTLAHGGTVGTEVLAALARLRESGRRLILVTGRELADLGRVFSHFECFEYIVAENGATLYHPATRIEKPLADPPPDEFVQALRTKAVQPLSVGQVIVATWQPHETVVLETIRDQGLELQVVFNKGAVMVLPSGVNKATGLQAALLEMQLSPHNVVAIGDAENDHALLTMAEVGVAVANAIPMLIERADLLMRGRASLGVTELIDRLCDNDLVEVTHSLVRHNILLGHDAHGRGVSLPPFGANVLLCGPPGSGKSVLAAALLERLTERGYQVCVIDPAGDYDILPGAVVEGSVTAPPDIEKVVQLFDNPLENVVVNMQGVPLAERPSFFVALLAKLGDARQRLGRPHWIVVDDAHQVLPAAWENTALAVPQLVAETLYITAESDQLATATLNEVHTVIALGGTTNANLTRLHRDMGLPLPEDASLAPGEGFLWSRRDGPPSVVRLAAGKTAPRLSRKYVHGDLSPEQSFYFRGPEDKLNLRAHNMMTFLQMAEGVDDETWLFHLRRGDYAAWFRDQMHDAPLGDEAARIAAGANGSAGQSRAALRALIQERYHLPSDPPVTAHP